MRIAIVYGTTEGQTRKVAECVAETLKETGAEVVCADASLKPPVDLATFDGILIAASLHAGRFQGPLVHYAASHKDAIAARANAFLCVSLAAASDDPKDRQGLDDCLKRLMAETGWTPGAIEHVAGAFRFTEYDFFKRWVMRLIAHQKGMKVDPHADLELTDYDALRTFARGFAGRVAAKAA